MAIVQKIVDKEGIDITPAKFINKGSVDIVSLTLADKSAVQIITMFDKNIGKVFIRHNFEPEEQLIIKEDYYVTMNITFEGKPAKIIWTQINSPYQFYAPL